jgi:hypothetical protein
MTTPAHFSPFATSSLTPVKNRFTPLKELSSSSPKDSPPSYRSAEICTSTVSSRSRTRSRRVRISGVMDRSVVAEHRYACRGPADELCGTGVTGARQLRHSRMTSRRWQKRCRWERREEWHTDGPSSFYFCSPTIRVRLYVYRSFSISIAGWTPSISFNLS